MTVDNRGLAENMAELPYTRVITIDKTTDGEPIFLARLLEIDGCIGQGTTPTEASADLHAATVDFIEALLDDAMPVPEPSRLLDTTVATSAIATVSFVGERSVLTRKPESATQDAYVLAPRA